MKLVQFRTMNDVLASRIGVVIDDQIADVTNEGAPATLIEMLDTKNALEVLQSLAKKSKKIYAINDVKLLSPITKPDKVICIGMNYKEHCDETHMPYPPEPVVFSKFSSSITGPYDDVVKSKASNAVDWEVELVVVIGKQGKNINIEDAFDYVLGYTAGQDLTARDWSSNGRNAGQFLLAKSHDQFCPLGPWIVTKDELPNPHNLKLKTWVNGVIKQDGHTSELVHGIDKIISYISSVMTLLPGDVIMTGTPSGVGFFRKPPQELKVGDLLETEVEGIGKLSNRLV